MAGLPVSCNVTDVAGTILAADAPMVFGEETYAI
jgi:hypothetical protein